MREPDIDGKMSMVNFQTLTMDLFPLPFHLLIFLSKYKTATLPRFPGSRHTTAGRTRGGRICCYQTHGSDLRPPLLSSLTGRASTEDLLCITVQSGRFGSARLDGEHYTRTHRESGATKTLMKTKPTLKINFFKSIIEANGVLKVLSKKYLYVLFLNFGI